MNTASTRTGYRHTVALLNFLRKLGIRKEALIHAQKTADEYLVYRKMV